MAVMNTTRSPLELRLERRDARIASARRLSRLSVYALFACTLAAIWQERTLAPPVHDGMIVLVDQAVTFIYESEGSGYSTAMTGLGGGADGSQYGLITDTLLKLRN
ncbi:MAG: hypothetical protein AAGA28_14170 [Pseudomonadota bacterium]